MSQTKNFGILKLTTLAILASLVFSTSGCSLGGGSSAEPTEEATKTPESAMGGYCLVIMRYLNDAVDVMAGAGETTTIDDIDSVLKYSGDQLSKGFDASNAGSTENAKLLQEAGDLLLKIRVKALNGDDPTTDSKAFIDLYSNIKTKCDA